MIELPSWLKIGKIIEKLDFSNWFSRQLRDDQRKYVGGDYIEKVEIHNHAPSGTIEEDPLARGLYTLGLERRQVDTYGGFFNSFYLEVEKRRERQITRSAHTMLLGAVFAVGTKYQNNPEWKEHCSSSLREIFHEWSGPDEFRRDLVSVYNHSNAKGGLATDEEDSLTSFWLLYRYFSSIDHHQASGILHALRAFLRDSSLKIEDCVNDDIFIERAKDFFSHLSRISEIAKKRTEP